MSAPSRLRRLGREVRSWFDFSSLAKSDRAPFGKTPFFVITAVAFFQALDTSVFSVATPEIARDLRISVTQVAGIGAVVGVVSVGCTLAVAWYADRRRRAPLVGLGALLSGLFSMVSARSTGAVDLGMARSFDDLSDTVSTTPRFSLLVDYYAFDRIGKVIAAQGSALRVAEFTAPPLAGYLVARSIGWRPTLVLFGLPLIVLGVVALVLLREPIRGYHERRFMGASVAEAKEEGERVSIGEAWRTMWAIPTQRRTFIGVAWTSAGTGVFAFVMPFLMADVYALDAFQRSLLALPSTVAAVVGGLMGGNLIDRLGRVEPTKVLYVTSSFSLLTAIGNMVLFLSTGNLTVLIAGNAVTAFGSALVGPAVSAISVQVTPPAIRTFGVGLVALGTLPGIVIVRPLAAQIAVDYGYRSALMLSMPLLVVGAIVLISASSHFEPDRQRSMRAAMASLRWRRERAEGRGKLLVARNLGVAYDGVQVVFDASFEVDRGEKVALLGTNGAGKSTVLRAIAGIQEASSGVIVLDGRDITHMPPHEIFARGVVTVAGGRGVFPGLTVAENLEMARWKSPGDGEGEGDDGQRLRTSLEEVFARFPVLRSRLQAKAGDLSGGEQQMLALAQALIVRPRLLLIDELSLGLAPTVVGELLDVVDEIAAGGTAVIVVEQSVNVAADIAERAIFMEKGEIRFDGPVRRLLARPDALRAVHLGGGAIGGSSPRRAPADVAGDERPPALEVLDVHKRYGGVVALDGVGMAVPAGRTVGLIGPNGSGKSTLFDVVSGAAAPDDGRILFEGADITTLPAHERAVRGIVRRFQDARLYPALTVFETILVALERRHGDRRLLLSTVGGPGTRRAERKARARAEELVELLDLHAYRDRSVRELSTGLRRIVDLAVVLAAAPKVLLLDEPSTGIAQSEVENLAPLLRRAQRETGCAIVLVEHDMPLLRAVCEEVVALAQGRVLVTGPPDDVLADERVVEAYLGANEVAVRRSGVTA